MLTSNHHWDGPVYTGINLIVLVETSAYRKDSQRMEKNSYVGFSIKLMFSDTVLYLQIFNVNICTSIQTAFIVFQKPNWKISNGFDFA